MYPETSHVCDMMNVLENSLVLDDLNVCINTAKRKNRWRLSKKFVKKQMTLAYVTHC